MLSQVDVTTNQGALLELPFGDQSNGYLVKDIDGLDPVKATLVSSSFANMDGEQYHSSRRESRNIVFKLGLEAGAIAGSARDLRNNLYKFFMPKTSVSLRFYDEDLGFVDIEGRVESFDCPLFTKEPEATISLLCYDPDFYEPELVTFSGLTTWMDIIEAEINYTGTIETGFAFQIGVDFDLPDGFTIYHRAPDNTFSSLEFNKPLSAGDVINISTVSGAKGATLSNASGTSSILWGVTQQSNWINLFPGTNYIRVFVEEEGALIPFTIQYTNKHGGL
jgi:hypothetical protein